MRRRSLLGLAAGVALASAPTTAAAQLSAPALPDVDWAQKLGAQLPLELTFERADATLGARTVALGELVDEKPVILAFVYYECPMLCNLVLDGLVSSLRALSLDVGDEFDVVVLGIDPDETVELAADARETLLDRYGRPDSASGWHFLIGEEANIAAAAGAVGFDYTYVRETDEYAHAAGICVLTPDGELARIFYGSEFAPRDVEFGLIDASNGTIGSPIQKVILRCFHYDPTKGEYGFAIMGALRFGGLLTVGLLVLFVVRMIRRERAPAELSAGEAKAGAI